MSKSDFIQWVKNFKRVNSIIDLKIESFLFVAHFRDFKQFTNISDLIGKNFNEKHTFYLISNAQQFMGFGNLLIQVSDKGDFEHARVPLSIKVIK